MDVEVNKKNAFSIENCFRAAFKLGRHVFLRSGAKTQNRQYGQLKWVLRSIELTQGKETFNIYELNSHEPHFIRNMDEFQSSFAN